MANASTQTQGQNSTCEVLIIGGGSAGIGVAASLLKRQSNLGITIIEPSDNHYYQPAFTLVGGGAFNAKDTVRPTRSVMPKGVNWIQASAEKIDPENNAVTLSNGDTIQYEQLVVSPGLRLAWEKIEGLEETLGKNGVTSNYRYDLAPYTWELVSSIDQGKVLFTQPAMPIKCAGAPQKAMYLSGDHWFKRGNLNKMDIEFNLATPGLFGVKAYVEPLMQYVKKYQAKLVFTSNLVKIDGKKKIAWFDIKDADGNVTQVEKTFDLIHVVPPQVAPVVVSSSPLADAGGWCEVDHHTLQHPKFSNVFAVGDICGTPNAKTAAAARKQVVVVAENIMSLRANIALLAYYDGYGSCPLTVEKGKVILAEFGYGGKLLPTFALDSTKPRKSAWFLKATMLPWVYWNCMLKGREWLAKSSFIKS